MKKEWVKVHASGGVSGQDIVPYYINYTGANPCPHMVGQFQVVLGDEPSDSATLMEERKTYTIDRLVGRVHIENCAHFNTDGSLINAPLPYMVRYGFIVQDVQDNGNPTDTLFDPFSPATLGGGKTHYFAEENWLWCETMLMGNNAVYGGWEGGGLSLPQKWSGLSFPANNQWGAVDRTKIDVKTKRRVGQGQRLFFIFAAAPIAPQELDYAGSKPMLTAHLDVRCLMHWSPQQGAGIRR